jgi:hypothetical protein
MNMTYPNRNWDKGEGYITELPNRCTACDGYLFVELKIDSDFDFTGSMELETEKVE